jgi:hypothetical protein
MDDDADDCIDSIQNTPFRKEIENLRIDQQLKSNLTEQTRFRLDAKRFVQVFIIATCVRD